MTDTKASHWVIVLKNLSVIFKEIADAVCVAPHHPVTFQVERLEALLKPLDIDFDKLNCLDNDLCEVNSKLG